MFDRKVVNYLDLFPTEGDVGIEIEMETELPLFRGEYEFPLWRLEEDHSLKINGTEFVLDSPCKYEDVEEVIKTLKTRLDRLEVKITPSIRAGVHVHLNMQDNTIGDVFRLMSCYYPIESVLTRFCGEGREGNLFCLRSQDAEYALYCAEAAVEQEDIYKLRSQNLRYASMNLQSLFQYGSVEFRALATIPDLSNIPVWCEILHRLQRYSLETKCCWDSLSAISGEGPREWLKKVVGGDLITHLDYPDLERDMMNDVRNSQGLCHALKMKGL